MAYLVYPAVIDRSTSGFGASFPDFPGCIAAGDTVQAAAINAEAALALHIDGMQEDGDPIPSPSPADQVPWEPDMVAVMLVKADVPGRSVRLNVSLDEGLVAAIDKVAANRSGFLAAAAREKLQRQAAG